ncbi:MAG: hypothetical protein J7K71_01375 [Candidatus Omnitrophica bacterium]|nr:hypothetical protein [Candidatus Omnitrophota bacterium]
MIKKIFLGIFIMWFLLSPSPSFSYSVRGHLINMGKNLVEFTFSPLYGALIKGPKNIKKAYSYEVWGREKPEKRGLLRYRLFAIWRAPGEEVKGIIEGLEKSIIAGADFIKELISIFFSD